METKKATKAEPPRLNALERIIIQCHNKPSTLTTNFPPYNQGKRYYQPNVTYAKLEKGIWGLYHSITDTITNSTEISADAQIFTNAHEHGHYYNKTGDEPKTDSYAVGQTGKWYYHREFGPGPVPSLK